MDQDADRSDVGNLPLVDRLASAAVLAPAEELPAVAGRIDEAFDALEPPERERLVAALAGRGERQAAEAWVRLTTAHVPAGRLERLHVDGFLIAPRHARVLFPAVFEHLAHATHRADVLTLLRAYCQAGAMNARRLAPHAPRLLGLLADLDARVRDQAAFGGVGWRWQGDYPRARATAGDLLDVLGHLPVALAAAPLTDALALPDPLLRLHAACALWRLGEPVPAATFAPLVADPETRAWTWECCVAAQCPGHVPAAARTPLRLAASAVAAWCAQPWLLGAVPEDVRLVGTARARADADRPDAYLPLPADADDAGAYGEPDAPWEPADETMEWWYLFQARVPAGHPASDDRGIAALAGPLPRVGSVRSAVPAFIASLGERWESRTPTEHFARLLEARQAFPIAPPCR